MIHLIEVEAEIKKWGNSFAIRLPIETIEKAHLHQDEKVKVFIEKKGDLSFLAGTVKTKRSTKDILKDIDEGWDDY